MASMVPYRSVFGIRPAVPASWLDAFDDMMDFASSPLANKAFPIDVEDKGDQYEVKAYLTGVNKDDIDVELNEGRLSITVDKKDSDEEKAKNYLQKETGEYTCTRGVFLKDAATTGLSAKLADGILTVNVPKQDQNANVTKVSID